MKRGDNCYICGKAMPDVCVIVQREIDGKDRDVHSRCAKRRDKALQDLGDYSYSPA